MRLIKIFLLLLLSTLFINSAFAKNFNSQQKKFVNFMIPLINQANNAVLGQRQKLIKLYNQYENQKPISVANSTWLKGLANSYKLKKVNFANQSGWQALLSRVDIIPPSLILAQSINESAWGRSRFAKQGNNYFGQWCSKPGCGLVPKRRKPGSIWEVAKFNSAYDSIASYLKNVNTNRAYRKLRAIRYELRELNKPLNPETIAKGLEDYSARGKQYITIMASIMNQYQLAQYIHNYSVA